MRNESFLATRTLPYRLLLASLQTVCLLIVGACALGGNAVSRPGPARGGTLDLRAWDPARDGAARLDGEWRILWARLAGPEEAALAAEAPEAEVGTILVPGSWRGQSAGGPPLGAMGHATYLLTVLLRPEPTDLFIRLPVISSAYRLYANGTLVSECGIVGTSVSEERPEWRPTVQEIEAAGPRLDLVLQLSNYHHNRGGPLRSIELTDASLAPFLREPAVALDLFLVGALFIMGIYHITLYALRRRDAAPLYFGLFCLAIALRTLATGDNIYLLRLFPGLDWEILQKIIALSFAAAVPFFSAFVRSLFPAVYPRWMLRLVAAATAALSAVVLVTAARVHTWLDIPYQIVTVGGALVVMHALFAALRRRLPGAGAFLAGFAVLFAATLNDILFGDGLIRSTDLVGVGLLVFVLSESYVLSRRSASAIELVERQTRELESMNQAYEAEIGVRTRMETDLRESENTARALLDVPFSEAVLIDAQGTVIYHNEAFRAAVGGGEPLIGRSIWDLVDPETAGRRRSLVQEVVDSGTLRRFEDQRDGRWYDVVAYPVRGADGAVRRVALLAHDVSERMRLEREAREQQRKLVEADRLSSLGVLVAGVAHEINNPNHMVLLYSQLLEQAVPGLAAALDRSLEQEPGMRIAGLDLGELKRTLPEMVSTIKGGAGRIASIVSELKSYARDESDAARGRVDVNEMVSAAVSLTRNLIAASTDRFNVHLGAGLPPVQGVRQRLEQVVVNLIQNACQALGEPSRGIEVRTELEQHAQTVLIRVRDEGAGMDDRTLSRIKDPFFTTRRDAGGTGLGLSVSAGIVQQHGGELEFRSAVGRGTEAIVSLPALVEAVQEQTA